MNCQRKMLNPAGARVLKRLRYPLDAVLACVRWYVTYPLAMIAAVHSNDPQNASKRL
jgi:hypothetical protein